MSRATAVRTGCVLVLGLLAVPGPVTGQEPEPATAAQLRAELDALRPRLEARHAEARRRREEARAREITAPTEATTDPPAPPVMSLVEALSPWLGGRGMINRVVAPADLYRRLVLEPSAAHRRCASGDGDACMAALGVDSGAEPGELRSWYDASAARAVVWERANGTSEWDRSDVRACLRSEGEACLQVLDRWGFARTAPVTMAARASLARYALAMGGEGARDRLGRLDPESKPSELLSAAAGRPVHALVADWAASLKEAHPRHGSSEERRDRGTALAWASVFAFLAMTNTRWRIGR